MSQSLPGIVLPPRAWFLAARPKTLTAAIVPIDYTSTSFVSQNYKLSNGGYNANPIGIINSFDEQQTIIANENNAIMTEKIKFNIVSFKYTAP